MNHSPVKLRKVDTHHIPLSLLPAMDRIQYTRRKSTPVQEEASKKLKTPKAKGPKEEQPNNPLHGVKLTEILEFLIKNLGWEKMAAEVNINCFKSNQTLKSSLKFLRTTPWAREKVERLYLRSIKA